ncbi:MAG: GMC family oxidoreductase N-terminal domain-containing protein [Micromonosporaceae bacterium]
MKLSARQQRALASICDTFCPDTEALPRASELGVPEALLGALSHARPAEQRQVGQLLSLWDSRVLTAVGGGGLRRFSTLPREARERVLLSWADSRSAQRRAAFQALRKGALVFYYMLPGRDGGRNPVWQLMGYPGPLGTPPAARAKPLAPTTPETDTTLDCDVVVVGSGAGGGTTAGVLAGAGLDVVVLEAGGYYDQADFDGTELAAITGYYMAAPSATDDQSVALLAGACLGGGTVVNYSTSFRTPGEVRAEWASHGVPAFDGEDYTRSLDAVCERLGVNTDHNAPSARDRIMRDGCEKLGWHIDAMPRNVIGCDQGIDCGYCGLGCRRAAKQSTTETWLADAAAAGARLLVRTRAERVIVSNGAARGVEAVTAAGHQVTVRARAVVVACGALHTPALLRRSGLRNPNVGRHLRLHPATALLGRFTEEVRGWEGTMQALYSDQHRHLVNGYGVKYETAPAQPHVALVFLPWRGSAPHLNLIRQYAHWSPMGVVLRDHDSGEVRVGRDGEPVVRYRLSDFDRTNLRTGIDGAAQILEAAGAVEIMTPHTSSVSYQPGRGSREQLMADADAAGYGAGQLQLGSFHIMGSARMGGSAATSACDPTGQTWEVRDLYVGDASAFPTSSGVNPMISIEAIAHMNARALAARLT